jgi:NTP pyrophosphatase (non-canonical NTP hydrolase)
MIKNCGNCEYSNLAAGWTPCDKCERFSNWKSKDETSEIAKLAKRIVEAEKEQHEGKDYWINICKMQQKQTDKGINKYGQILEENIKMTKDERITYLQEEMIDALMYCEHLKSNNWGLTPNEYQKLALRTANTKAMEDPIEKITNGSLGLSGESGEVADHIKKFKYQGHELDREHLAKELGDICWYIALLADGIGYNLETVMQMNVDKLKKRYPEGFEIEKSLHRESGDK